MLNCLCEARIGFGAGEDAGASEVVERSEHVVVLRRTGLGPYSEALMSRQVKTSTWPPWMRCGWSSQAAAAASRESASITV